MPGYGLAFQPGQQQQPSQPGQPRQSGSPAQQAIQLLSLRIPNLRPGVGALPSQLLQPQGGGAVAPESLAVLNRILGNAPSAPQGGGGGGVGGSSMLSNAMGGSDLLSQLMRATPPSAASVPQGAPTQSPQFMGNVDTPPMQNAPFDAFGRFRDKFRRGYDPNMAGRAEAANTTGGFLPGGQRVSRNTPLPLDLKVENDVMRDDPWA